MVPSPTAEECSEAVRSHSTDPINQREQAIAGRKFSWAVLGGTG